METVLIRGKKTITQCLLVIIFSIEKISDSTKQKGRIGWNKWILWDSRRFHTVLAVLLSTWFGVHQDGVDEPTSTAMLYNTEISVQSLDTHFCKI